MTAAEDLAREEGRPVGYVIDNPCGCCGPCCCENVCFGVTLPNVLHAMLVTHCATVYFDLARQDYLCCGVMGTQKCNGGPDEIPDLCEGAACYEWSGGLKTLNCGILMPDWFCQDPPACFCTWFEVALCGFCVDKEGNCPCGTTPCMSLEIAAGLAAIGSTDPCICSQSMETQEVFQSGCIPCGQICAAVSLASFCEDGVLWIGENPPPAPPTLPSGTHYCVWVWDASLDEWTLAWSMDGACVPPSSPGDSPCTLAVT